MIVFIKHEQKVQHVEAGSVGGGSDGQITIESFHFKDVGETINYGKTQ